MNNHDGKSVTIAIGLLCKDRIILASDSQTTRDNIKQLNAKKIHSAVLKNSAFLIAEAGNVDRCENLIANLVKASKDSELKDSRTVAEIAQQVITDYKRTIRESRFNCTAQELDDYIRWGEQDAELMLAHYFDNQPYIFVGSLGTGGVSKRADRQRRHFSAIGSGRDLAEYLLEEYSQPEMSFYSGMALTLFIISEVKKHDTYCNGQSRFAFIHPDNRGFELPQNLIDDLSNRLEEFSKLVKEDQNRKSTEALNKIGKEWENQ